MCVWIVYGYPSMMPALPVKANAAMCADVCVDKGDHTCASVCAEMLVVMCTQMSVHVCVPMCIDIC